jgi:hypothetical protein
MDEAFKLQGATRSADREARFDPNVRLAWMRFFGKRIVNHNVIHTLLHLIRARCGRRQRNLSLAAGN